MNITLFRNKTGPDGTFGTLSWNKRSWYSLEKPDLNNAPDTSCIPTGLYAIEIRYSNHMMMDTPHLINVPGREYILIHPANVQTELLGCIAIGEHLGVFNGHEGVSESRKAFGELMADIKGCNERVSIEIRSLY